MHTYNCKKYSLELKKKRFVHTGGYCCFKRACKLHIITMPNESWNDRKLKVKLNAQTYAKFIYAN